MASEIKVDTIVNAGGDNDTGIDLATNDQILLKVANATKLTMNSTGQTTIVGEGGTTTTSLQQGVCKVWAEFGGTSDGNSTITLNDSFNVASLTDNGTGDYTHAYTNNMASIDYVFVGSGQYTTGAVGAMISLNSKSGSIYYRGTSSVTTACKYMTPTGGPNDYDYEQQQFAEFGDLA